MSNQQRKTAIEKFWEMEHSTPKHIDLYVEKSMDILDRIYDLMEEEGINQRELAKRLDKSEAEVSKWLHGVQNFTLRTVCKLEEAFGKDIIQVSKKRVPISRFTGFTGGATTNMGKLKLSSVRSSAQDETIMLLAA